MKTLIKALFLIFLIIIAFNQKVWSQEKIKIGLIVPLSGEYKEIGDSIIKSVRLAVNKIGDSRIKILPKDTKSKPEIALKVSKELYNTGVRIIIGPVFNSNVKYLDELKDITFLSFTNKINNNPKNVISSGVNAISQLNTIKKFQKLNGIERSIFLIPNTEFKSEIENAIFKTKIQLKDKFIYDTDPTLLTVQIERLTRYKQRKRNVKDEIERIENSNEVDKERKIENLKKRDTLGGINFDSIIIGDFDENLKSIATSFLYTDISSKRITYICLNQWLEKRVVV